MVALVPISSRNISQPQDEKRSWTQRVFPAHTGIAWRSILGVWTGYFVFAVIQARISQQSPLGSFVATYLSVAFISIIATWILYRMMSILGGRNIFHWITFFSTLPSFILALALMQLNYWIGTKPLFFPELFPAAGGLIGATNVLIPYLLLIIWGGIYLALAQNEEMESAVQNSQKLRKIARESEQRALRYQLNPHFIFNALNSVSSLVVDNKNEQAEKLVDELAYYMRAVLDDEGEEMVTVSNEIAQQIRYLEIEKVRFPDRMQYEMNIAEDVADWKIPALIIQPLIENAIKHGVARSTKKVRILIEALEEQNRLKISIRNTGRMKIASDDIGKGLANISDRLKVLYGPSAALITRNSDDGMAVATVTIPDETFALRTVN